MLAVFIDVAAWAALALTVAFVASSLYVLFSADGVFGTNEDRVLAPSPTDEPAAATLTALQPRRVAAHPRRRHRIAA